MKGARVQRARSPDHRSGWSAPSGPLPSDLIRDAAGRLSAFATVILASAIAYAALEIGSGISDALGALRLFAIGFIAVFSAALALSLRRVTLEGWQVYWMGFAYLASVAMVVSISRHSLQTAELRGWSAAAILSLLFPVLVPCSPRRAALASTSVLAIAVTAFGLTRLIGLPIPSLSETVRLFMGELLAIPIAAFVSSVVYGLGRELASARKLGSYELDDVLGRGGMGEVWRAHHSLLARPAAIKLIRTDTLAHTSADVRLELLQRFEREAQATAALKCPHTVGVFDFGISDDGTFYYVMELLEGVDLHDLVARHGPVPAGRAVDILKQTCLSLSEAHGQGMVHRDIKPSNIVLCRLGEEVDFVKVVDFGLVTPSHLHEGGDRMTERGQITGTPAFISPEQGRGDTNLDGRSDIYALGCVAYWLLTGQIVFEGTPMEMVASHIKDPPRPPSDATLTSIPPELEALILQCLEKNPADRPRTAREVHDALEALDLPPSWSKGRAAAWWRTHHAPAHDEPRPSTLPLPEA